MNKFGLGFLFFLWLILTFVLSISIVGWILIFPTPNMTQYHMSIDDRRSTWMQLGVDLKNELLNY